MGATAKRARRRGAVAIAGLCATTTLLACATPDPRLYEGPPRERAAIARIREPHSPSVRVTHVDGRAVDGEFWDVLPGPHVVTASARASGTISESGLSSTRERVVVRVECQIEFEARPGVEYVVIRIGDFEKIRPFVFKANLAVDIAERTSPDDPIGRSRCGDQEVSARPVDTEDAA